MPPCSSLQKRKYKKSGFKLGGISDVMKIIVGFLDEKTLFHLAHVSKDCNLAVAKATERWFALLAERETKMLRDAPAFHLRPMSSLILAEGIRLTPAPDHFDQQTSILLRGGVAQDREASSARTRMVPRSVSVGWGNAARVWTDEEKVDLACYYKRFVAQQYGSTCFLCGCSSYTKAVKTLQRRVCSLCLRTNLISNVVLELDYGVFITDVIRDWQQKVWFFSVESKRSRVRDYTKDSRDLKYLRRVQFLFWRPHVELLVDLESKKSVKMEKEASARKLAWYMLGVRASGLYKKVHHNPVRKYENLVMFSVMREADLHDASVKRVKELHMVNRGNAAADICSLWNNRVSPKAIKAYTESIIEID